MLNGGEGKRREKEKEKEGNGEREMMTKGEVRNPKARSLYNR